MYAGTDLSFSSRRPHGLVRAILFAVSVLALFFSVAPVWAQSVPTSLLVPGNAVVTGFSGVVLPAQLASGVNPAGWTFIDLNGPSLRVVDLQRMSGAPNAQLVDAPKPFTIPAALIGQVFAVALDNSVPPNIYAAATSAYGLPIVRPNNEGRLTHSRIGLPGTSFMPGLWGGAAPGGGPGSIWKIDGVSGVVSLFADVTLNGVPNSGPALGGLAFDPDSNSLFVADRETGLIHRFNMDGREIGRFDHGLQARAAVGLPSIAFDPSQRLDITDRKFDSTQPATWNYAAPERRIFGLGIRAGRLYYAVADGLQIWSVAVLRDGFTDPVLEINVPPGSAPSEISKITFDDQGRMILGERPIPSGANDFGSLTQQNSGRILRYAIADVVPGVPRAWQRIPDDYAIGMPPTFRNGNGGVAVGFDYDRFGHIDRGSCGGFTWSTGEQLRSSTDRGLAARLNQSGPTNVDGLQGNFSWTIRPQNAPPLRSYFIDFDDRFTDAAARGHMGDIAIWRVCGPALRGGWMLPTWFFWNEGGGKAPPPPKLSCPVDQQKPGFQCCPKGTSPGANGVCEPWCPNGKMDSQSQNICGLGFDNATYDPNNIGKLKCIGGSQPNPAKGILGCTNKSPVLNAAACQAGWSKQNIPNVGTVCAPTQEQLQCGPNQQVSSIDNKCHTICLGGTAWPTRQCCAAGSAVTPTGQCCPAGATVDSKTGKCSRTRTECPVGSKPDPTTGVCTPPIGKCPAGTTPDPQTGACAKLTNDCLPGYSADPQTGECKKLPPKFDCGPGQKSSDGSCCPSGQSAGPAGLCKLTICISPGKQVGGKCCSPDDLKPGGACAIALCGSDGGPAGASNACCDKNKIFTDKSGRTACCATRLVNGQCQPVGGTPVLPGCSPGSTDPNCCASGYKWAGSSCCLASQLTSKGQCCPAGQSPSGADKSQCQPSLGGGIPPFGNGGGTSTGTGLQCCASGLIPTASGACCAASQVTSSGICCPAGQVPDPKNRRTCVTTTQCTPRETQVNGACCLQSKVYVDGSGAKQCCPQDVNQATGKCGPVPGIKAFCAPGFSQMPDGSCCANNLIANNGKTCAAAGRPKPISPLPKFNPTAPQQNVPAAPRPGLRAVPGVRCTVVRGQTICR